MYTTTRYEVLLLEVLTLTPLGKASLRLPSTGATRTPDHLEYQRGAPSFIAIQRRSPTTWVLTVEVPKKGRVGHPSDHGSFLEVINHG